MASKNRLYQKFIFENVGKLGGYTVKFKLKNTNKVTIKIGCQEYNSIAGVKKAANEQLRDFKENGYPPMKIAAEKKAYAATIAKMEKLLKIFKKTAKAALR